MRYALTVASCVLIAVSCKTEPGDHPARIAAASDATLAVLRQTVNEIAGVDVTLSDTALTDSSVLVIENWPRQTLQNPVPQGRVMKDPIRLQLVINAGDCILVDTRDGSRHPLENVSCVAE